MTMAANSQYKLYKLTIAELDFSAETPKTQTRQLMMDVSRTHSKHNRQTQLNDVASLEETQLAKEVSCSSYCTPAVG